MNKLIIKLGLLFLSASLLLAAIAAIVIYFTTKISYTDVSNGDEVYAYTDTYNITKSELYEQMMNTVGASYLLDYIDTNLLKDYMPNQVEDADLVTEKINYLTYGTTDTDKIIAFANEVSEHYENEFNKLLVLKGYDPTDTDSIFDYIKLEIAKDNYVRSLILNADEKEDYFISDSDVKNYYDNLFSPTVHGISIKFNNQSEVADLYAKYNLVTVGGELRLYTDASVALEDVPSDNLNDDNTRLLTENEVFAYFIKIYNDTYTYRDKIDENITQNQLVANANAAINDDNNDMEDYFIFDYNNTVRNNDKLANYMFTTLNLDNENITPYTIDAKKLGNYYYLIYKIDQDKNTAYEELDSNTKDNYRNLLLSEILTKDYVDGLIEELHDTLDITIIDKFLAINYTNTVDPEYVFDGHGDESIIATYSTKNNDENPINITADDFYDFMEKRVGSFHAKELAMYKELLYSNFFTEIYGSETDLLNNTSTMMQQHITSLNDLRDAFNKEGFAEYGYTPDTYTWEEFLYVYYGVRSEYDAYLNIFIPQVLNTYYKYDNINYDEISQYIIDDYNNYFSLYTEHLLFYIDFDDDGTPDNYDNYVASLTPAEVTQLNNLLTNLLSDIETYLSDEDLTIGDLSMEYNNAGYSTNVLDEDYSVWAEYKTYGFVIKHENLNYLSYDSTTGYASNFVDSLQRLYALYSQDENTTKEYLYDTQLTTTPFGVHFLYVEQGEQFKKPSAFYSGDEHGFFSVEAQNNSDIPSKSQILVYNDIKFWNALQKPLLDESGVQMVDKDNNKLYAVSDYKIPYETVKNIEEYYSGVYTDLLSEEYYDASIVKDLLDAKFTFTNNNEAHQNDLNAIYQMYMNGLFD